MVNQPSRAFRCCREGGKTRRQALSQGVHSTDANRPAPGKRSVRFCRNRYFGGSWHRARCRARGPEAAGLRFPLGVFQVAARPPSAAPWPIGKTHFGLREFRICSGRPGPSETLPPSSPAFSGAFWTQTHGFRRLPLPCPFPSLLGVSLLSLEVPFFPWTLALLCPHETCPETHSSKG